MKRELGKDDLHLTIFYCHYPTSCYLCAKRIFVVIFETNFVARSVPFRSQLGCNNFTNDNVLGTLSPYSVDLHSRTPEKEKHKHSGLRYSAQFEYINYRQRKCNTRGRDNGYAILNACELRATTQRPTKITYDRLLCSLLSHILARKSLYFIGPAQSAYEI